MAAGRIQGQRDAMATSSISNLISSLLLHLSLLSPEAGNLLIWEELKMACGCYADSNCTLPNGLESRKGNLSANQRSLTPKSYRETWFPHLAEEGPGAGRWGNLPACFEVTPKQAARPGQPKGFRKDLVRRPFRRIALSAPFFFLIELYAQCGAWTHDSANNTRILYWVSQPGTLLLVSFYPPNPVYLLT